MQGGEGWFLENVRQFSLCSERHCYDQSKRKGNRTKQGVRAVSVMSLVVLFQGGDENTGSWRPFQETIKVGKTAPSPIVP